MSLNKLLEEIKLIKVLAEEDLSGGNVDTYQAREGRKRNAKDRLKSLKEQYTNELRLSASFIIVTGAGKDEFSKIAQEEFKCFTADPEGFYKDLASRLPEELYANKASTSQLFDVVGRHLEDKANEMEIIGYPQFIMKQTYQRTVLGKDDFIGLLKEALNEQIGSEIVGLHVIRSLVDTAINANHGGRVTPIIMTTNDEGFALDLHNTLGRIGSKSFLVVAGKGAKTVRGTEGAFIAKEVTKESVESTLKSISKLSK